MVCNRVVVARARDGKSADRQAPTEAPRAVVRVALALVARRGAHEKAGRMPVEEPNGRGDGRTTCQWVVPNDAPRCCPCVLTLLRTVPYAWHIKPHAASALASRIAERTAPLQSAQQDTQTRSRHQQDVPLCKRKPCGYSGRNGGLRFWARKHRPPRGTAEVVLRPWVTVNFGLRIACRC